MNTNNSHEVPPRSWSDLPRELLSLIADRLGLIELLSFRGSCKIFRSVSSTASAQIESTRKPWLLTYGDETSKCGLYDLYDDKSYTCSIPELEGTSCLASNHGWLLLFKQGSIFFFCPFSRAKISLPDFPHQEIVDHVGSFSSVPTAHDCIVTVLNRSDNLTMVINVIHRGNNTWTTDTSQRYLGLGTITCAAFNSGTFYYLDSEKSVLAYSLTDTSCTYYMFVKRKASSKDAKTFPFSLQQNYIRDNSDIIKRLNLENDESLATCGTLVPTEKGFFTCLHNEIITASTSSSKIRNLKGVWFQPRFFQVPANQSWAI